MEMTSRDSNLVLSEMHRRWLGSGR